MKITPKDTVNDIVMRNRALFSKAAERIVKAIQDLPEPEFVPMKRRMWFDKRLPVRDIAGITMGELNAIEARKPSYEYFCIVLGVMLGLVKFNRIGVDGKPDWTAGFSVDEEQIGRLRFIRAQRYFIAIQKGLEGIGKSWKKLEMPFTAAEMKARVKRPDRGLVAVCRKYCQIMNGAVKMDEVWNTPWAMVYEAFETCKCDNLEQRAIYEANKPKKRGR